MTDHYQPPQVMDLMAAFGRKNKTGPAPFAACQEPSTETAGYAALLRKHQLRTTLARIRILVVMQEVSPQLLDATAIYRALDLRSEHMAPGRINRALNDMWEGGLLIRRWSEPGGACYRIRLDSLEGMECLLNSDGQ